MCFSRRALRLSHSIDAVTVAAAALWAYYKFNRLFTHSLNSLRGAYDLRAMWMHVGRLLAFFCSIDGPTTKCLFATCISCIHQMHKPTGRRTVKRFRTNAIRLAIMRQTSRRFVLTSCLFFRFLFISYLLHTFRSIASNNIFIFYFKLAFLIIISFSGA